MKTVGLFRCKLKNLCMLLIKELLINMVAANNTLKQVNKALFTIFHATLTHSRVNIYYIITQDRQQTIIVRWKLLFYCCLLN